MHRRAAEEVRHPPSAASRVSSGYTLNRLVRRPSWLIGTLGRLGLSMSTGCDGPAVPGWAKRLPPPDSDTPVRSKMTIDRLIARRHFHLREMTLWRMPYSLNFAIAA
ncbi:hypothetical protein ACFU7T_00170 [Streptomyces sp. NPDC057555]|uniref:hypothetical protein n=1 Tax=Streptomyces sp. NPDC057555 TaxID=3346166 RepID=UPI003696F733